MSVSARVYTAVIGGGVGMVAAALIGGSLGYGTNHDLVAGVAISAWMVGASLAATIVRP